MQRSQSDDIAWYASHGSGRVICNLPSNAAVWAYSCTKAGEDLNIRIVRAQGIVRVGVTIRTST